jgi:hypothetical protein
MSAITRPAYFPCRILVSSIVLPPTTWKTNFFASFALFRSASQRPDSSGVSTPFILTCTRTSWPTHIFARTRNVSPSMTFSTTARTGPGKDSTCLAHRLDVPPMMIRSNVRRVRKKSPRCLYQLKVVTLQLIQPKNYRGIKRDK